MNTTATSRLESLEQLEAGEARHLDVEEQHVDRQVAQRRERAVPDRWPIPAIVTRPVAFSSRVSRSTASRSSSTMYARIVSKVRLKADTTET